MRKLIVASTLSLSLATMLVVPTFAMASTDERTTMLSEKRQEVQGFEKIENVAQSVPSLDVEKQLLSNQALHERINSTEFSTFSSLEQTSLIETSFKQQTAIYQELNKMNWAKLTSTEWQKWQEFLDEQSEHVEKKMQRLNTLFVETSIADKKMVKQLEKLHRTVRSFQNESLLLEGTFNQKVVEMNKLEIDILTSVTSLAIEDGRKSEAVKSWLDLYGYMRSDPEYFEILDALGEEKSPLVFIGGEPIAIKGEAWDSDSLWIPLEQAELLLAREIEKVSGDTWIFRYEESKVEWNEKDTKINEQSIGSSELVSDKGFVRIDLLLTFMGYEVKIHENKFVVEVEKPSSMPLITKWSFNEIRKIMLIK